MSRHKNRGYSFEDARPFVGPSRASVAMKKKRDQYVASPKWVKQLRGVKASRTRWAKQP